MLNICPQDSILSRDDIQPSKYLLYLELIIYKNDILGCLLLTDSLCREFQAQTSRG